MSTLVWPTLALALSALSPTSPEPLAAAHDADIVRDRVAWTSTYVFAADDLPAELTLGLLWPLPTEATVEAPPGATLLRDDDGRVTALVVTRDPLLHGRADRRSVRTLELRVVEPLRGLGSVTLHPPLALTPHVQRVTLDSTDAVRFLPAGALAAERRIGFTSLGDVSSDGRRRAEALLERAPGHLGAERVFLRADAQLVAAGGLAGHLEIAPAKRRSLGLAVAGVFALLCFAGVSLYRRFTGAAELERAEAILEAEYRGLG